MYNLQKIDKFVTSNSKFQKLQIFSKIHMNSVKLINSFNTKKGISYLIIDRTIFYTNLLITSRYYYYYYAHKYFYLFLIFIDFRDQIKLLM